MPIYLGPAGAIFKKREVQIDARGRGVDHHHARLEMSLEMSGHLQ
jgi:hypothetical protein